MIYSHETYHVHQYIKWCLKREPLYYCGTLVGSLNNNIYSSSTLITWISYKYLTSAFYSNPLFQYKVLTHVQFGYSGLESLITLKINTCTLWWSRPPQFSSANAQLQQCITCWSQIHMYVKKYIFQFCHLNICPEFFVLWTN